MKRIFITIAFFMLSTGLFAGEAWNNHLGFGWRLPTKLTLHSETKGYENLKMSWQTGLNLSYTGVLMSNGFSVRAIVDQCFTASNLEIADPDSRISSFPGFAGDVLAGIGWAPVRNKKFFFGFYGMLGLDFAAFYYDTDYFWPSDSKVHRTQNVYYASFLPGVNATFIWTPTGEHFSLFATTTVAYSCPTKIFYEYDDGTGNVKTSCITRGGTKVIPAVGISWRF